MSSDNSQINSSITQSSNRTITTSSDLDSIFPVVDDTQQKTPVMDAPNLLFSFYL